MTSREGETSRSFALRFRNVAFLLIATTVFCALGNALLDSAAARLRLSEAARERSLSRFSTTPSASSRASFPLEKEDLDSSAPSLSAARSDRDARLTLMAKDWLGSASNVDFTLKKHVVLQGLARWNVDEATARPFLSNDEDERFWREAKRGAEGTRRSATESAAYFADLGNDADIDVALTFLQELGDVKPVDEASETILWFDGEPSGNPVDFAGYVVAGDFESLRVFALSAQLCDAAARVFYSATLGVLLLGILPVSIPRKVLQGTAPLGIATLNLAKRSLSVFRLSGRFGVLFRLAILSTVRLLN